MRPSSQPGGGPLHVSPIFASQYFGGSGAFLAGLYKDMLAKRLDAG